MTTEMKKAFKMLKYCFQPKTNCAAAIAITVIGMISLGISSIGHPVTSSCFLMGSLYFVLGPSIMAQMLMITLYCSMVKSSPRARILEIQLEDLLSSIIFVLGYTLIILYSTIINVCVKEVYSPGMLFATALTICILLLYNSTVYKLFFTSTFIMAILIPFVFSIFTILEQTTRFGVFPLSMTASCLLGYLCILLSLVLSGLFRRAVYRLPLSKMAGGSKLRKQM